MKPVSLRREKFLGGLISLLFYVNAAVAILAATLAPRLTNFSWQGDSVSYFLNSRDLGDVPGIIMASAVLSVGVYFFVQNWLVLRDESDPAAEPEGPVTEPERGAA